MGIGEGVGNGKLIALKRKAALHWKTFEDRISLIEQPAVAQTTQNIHKLTGNPTLAGYFRP